MKYLLIDGNNLAIRNAFANAELKNIEGVHSGVHFGVFQSLIDLKKQYNGFKFLIVWDSKSIRRVKEAAAGVEQGLVKSGYKENRERGDEMAEPLKLFYEHSTMLKLAIEKAGIPQIKIDGYEADDVIASYCKRFEKDNTVVCVTTDKDYYQLLSDNTSIWNGMTEKLITKKEFVDKNQIEPPRHVDCGAFSGDSGDNIFGVPGWGEKTALKYIQQYGDWKGVLKFLHEKYDDVRKNYPDITGDAFAELAAIETKSGKPKYPEVVEGMPFSGVALALEKKEWKPEKSAGVKQELMALMFENRIELAYSLKKMDTDIAGLPEIPDVEFDKEKVLEYFSYFDIQSLKEDLDVFA